MSMPSAQYDVVDAWTCIGMQPDDDRDLSAAALEAQLCAEHVGHALVTSFTAIRYDQTIGNRELEALCAGLPALSPVAVINPSVYVGLKDLVESARKSFVGLRFTPYRQGWSLHSEPFISALALADSAGLPVSVETGASGDATWLASLSNGLQVPLILAHITYATMGEALSVLEDHPNLHLELTRLVSPGILEILVKRLGSDRLLYASGAPAWAMAPALEIIRQAEISSEARAAILGANARRLFGLQAGKGTP